jgi:hypothetical protein
MKKWLVYMLKKFIENIFMNGAKYLLGLLLVGGASLTYNSLIQNLVVGQTTVERWVLYLPYFLIFLAIVYLILRIPLLPRLSWEYIFGLNQHTICYIEKDKLEFTKTLSIWPLSRCVRQVSYDYMWTGSQIDDIALKRIDGKILVDKGGTGTYPNKGTLKIDFNENPRLLRRCECDVIYQLNDARHKMQRRLVITVKRPTLRIVLRVVANPCVTLKNVTASECDLYGDKTEDSKSMPLYSMKYGAHTSAQTYYEWEIKHPKLFSKYEITWDIV